MYLTQEKCKSGCMDPTKGCNTTSGTCYLSNKCQPNSTCDCGSATIYQGLQISNNYTQGLWSINITVSKTNAITSLKLTPPDGYDTTYDVTHWQNGTGAPY